MLDPYTGDATEMGAERIEKNPKTAIRIDNGNPRFTKFCNPDRRKPGQMRRSLALKLKRTLAKHGKRIPVGFGACWS